MLELTIAGLAPHLPVHLGSMSTCVSMQAKIWKGKLNKGDVLVSNHPEFGGTHLPGNPPPATGTCPSRTRG